MYFALLCFLTFLPKFLFEQVLKTSEERSANLLQKNL
jgi:hypothetical protein